MKANGAIPEPEDFGWDEAVDRHLARMAVERGLARNSLDAYGRDLADFARFCIGKRIRPESLSAAAVITYLERLAARGLGPSSQRRYLASVRGLIRGLVAHGLLSGDPTVAVKLRPHPRPLPGTLSPKDIEALLAAIDTRTPRGARDRAMLELAYGSGLRVSELVGLQLHQIDLTAGLLAAFGKGGKERIVPVGRAAKQALKTYLGEPRAKLLKERTSAAVFVGRGGHSMTRQAFFKALKGWAQSDPRLSLDGRTNIVAALLDVPLHRFACTHAIAIRNPLEDLQVLMAGALRAIASIEINHAEDKDPLVDAAQMI